MIPGFRSELTTTNQLHRIDKCQLHGVVDTISSALETKKHGSGVFLDVAKALYNILHVGLLYTK